MTGVRDRSGQTILDARSSRLGHHNEFACPPEQHREQDQFKIGDRVRLSTLGKARSPRTVPTGEIVGMASRKSGYGSVCVLLDGLKLPRRFHLSYLELIEDAHS